MIGLVNAADQHYHGPDFSHLAPALDINEYEEDDSVLYIAPDGSVLDAKYRPSSISIESIPPFPDTSSFAAYFEYEQAVIQWKTKIEAILNEKVKLPTIVGRHYYRPRSLDSCYLVCFNDRILY